MEAVANRGHELCLRTGDIVDSLINSGQGHPTDFSVTVASRDAANIQVTHSEAVSTYLQTRTVRGGVSLERGKGKGNLHCQGVMTVDLMRTYPDPNKLNTAMRKHLRGKCGFTAADRIKIEMKPLVNTQTFAGEQYIFTAVAFLSRVFGFLAIRCCCCLHVFILDLPQGVYLG